MLPLFMTAFITAAIAVLFFMTVAFMAACVIKRNDLADIAWGFGFILVTGVTYCIFGSAYPKQILVSVLVFLWGIRLSGFLYMRNRKRGEDKRYQEYRLKWKQFFYLRSYLQIFLLQGFLLLLISLPVIFINATAGPEISWLDGIAFVLWVVGFVFESFGDYQLTQFIKNPKNKGHVMQSGLWKYTRHPNYFGEVTQWWAIFLLAVSLPGSLFTVIGPLLITYLITKVSGIPLLENKYEGKPEWEEYKKRTSVFIPLPPK